MRKLWRFVKLQIVLWHSDYHTDWYRLRLRYEDEKAKNDSV